MLKQRENALSDSFYDAHFYIQNSIDEVLQTQQPALALHVGSHLDPGTRRKYRPNEDTLIIRQGVMPSASTGSSPVAQKPFVLLLVADGMGGLAHGRRASRLASYTVAEYVSSILCSQPMPALHPASLLSLLSAGVQEANYILYEQSQPQQMEMGTTMTAVLLIESTAYVAHVGDSRLYLYRNPGGLSQITHDHSVVANLVATGVISPEDIYTHPWRNQIYRCLGDKPEEEVDTFMMQLATGDILLLCTDGLWEMVHDQQIESLLTTPMPTSLDTAHALIEAALANGGEDNVSAIVARVSNV